MSTSPTTPNPPLPPDAEPATGGAGPTPEAAKAMLDRASQTSRTLPAQIPAAFITYGVLCVLGTATVLGFHLASKVPADPNFDPRIAVLVMFVAWIGAGMVPIFVFRDRWRRGLGMRWGIYMAGWAVLWIVGSIVATTQWALLISPMFMVLFVVVITQEAARVKRDAVTDTRGASLPGGEA